MAGILRTLACLAVGRIVATTLNDHPRLARKNFRGAPVTLAGGLGCATGAVAGAIVNGHAPAVIMNTTAAGLGLADDLDENPASHRGLRGHLSALKEGHITTGFLKLAGIGVAAAVSAAMIPRNSTRSARALDWAIDATILAGSANVVNLLDLRPGRANKALIAAMAPLLFNRNQESRTAAGATLALSATALPEDLGEKTMLGDTGANTLGAYGGYALCTGLSRTTRIMVAATVVAATLISEKVSFSAVIEKTPGLREIDQWGRL